MFGNTYFFTCTLLNIFFVLKLPKSILKPSFYLNCQPLHNSNNTYFKYTFNTPSPL